MTAISKLSIDLETYSDIDIQKSGVYRYAESDAFEILLFAVSINDGPVRVFDLASGEQLPDEILNTIVDQQTIKWAFNAAFERICLSNWLKKHYPNKFQGYGSQDESTINYLSPISWRCSMIWAAYLGLPLSLEKVGAVLQLEEQKINEGKELIRYFSMPCKPTKTNHHRTRNLPFHAPEKWHKYKFYNQRDVEVEMAIQLKLQKFPVPDFLWEEYHLDQEINDRGIGLDIELVKYAIELHELSKSQIIDELKQLTGLENPNSVVQMKAWLANQGLITDSLDKKVVNQLLQTAPPNLVKVLSLRQKVAKSSMKKYQAMENAICKDGRAHGMFQFYGGNRTGRWAGRLIQLQNLPQNHMPDLEYARMLVKNGEFESMELLYEDIPDTLSQLIRTAFIPKSNRKFIVSDFSAIEARVIAHLSGEFWREDIFKKGGDIYCASASKMFGVPVEKHGVNGHLRQKGKIAELALGYGGSVGALKAMGALEMGLLEDELQPLVDAWRFANPNIVQFWWDVDYAVKTTIQTMLITQTHGIKFLYKSGILFIHLPSGRNLSYIQPQITENHFGGESISYFGIGPTKKWERIESYGPKFVENIVQAISRDLLAFSMKNLKDFSICGHVHDEVIIECANDESVSSIVKLMSQTPAWMSDILLNADGYETSFYKKD